MPRWRCGIMHRRGSCALQKVSVGGASRLWLKSSLRRAAALASIELDKCIVEDRCVTCHKLKSGAAQTKASAVGGDVPNPVF